MTRRRTPRLNREVRQRVNRRGQTLVRECSSTPVFFVFDDDIAIESYPASASHRISETAESGFFGGYEMNRTFGFLVVALTVAIIAPLGLSANIQNGHAEHFAQCAKACSDCQLQCETCCKHCQELVADGKQEHGTMAKLCADCGECCKTCALLCSRSGPLARLMADCCAKCCDECAACCDKNTDDKTMVDCAKSCKDCAKVCREMAKQASK